MIELAEAPSQHLVQAAAVGAPDLQGGSAHRLAGSRAASNRHSIRAPWPQRPGHLTTSILQALKAPQ
eukprot:4422117-Pyramimonas_sp.AAC.2